MIDDLALKELADYAPVLIWRAGPDGRCDFFNKSWLDFTGRRMNEEIGAGWVDGVHAEDRERCLAGFREALDERREFTMDYRLRRRDGEYRWVLSHARPFYRGSDGFAGYFGSCIDITEHKAAEERLQAMLRQYNDILREKEALTAEIHHRVRNNLQVMLGLVGLSMRHAPDQACRKVLESFADRIQALAVVQTHLHEADDVSQIELRSYAAQLADALARLYKGDQVRIAISGDRYPLPPHDANTIGLILAELLANSFKHAFAEGRTGTISIQITAETDGAARIAVGDDGPGFNPEEAERRRGGVGLTLVRTYAGQIGACVAHSSSDGTLFEITLPTPQH